MIAEIEKAICARLDSASKLGLLGYRLKTVETYGGQLEGDELTRAIPKLPACFVTFIGEKGQGEHTNTAYRFEGRFAVIIATRNARNEAATRHGAGNEAGSYQIRRDVRLLLTDQRLGLAQGRLVPEGTTSLFNGEIERKKLSILSVEFSVTYMEKFIAERDLPAALPPAVVEEAKRRADAAGRELSPAELAELPPLRSVSGEWLGPCGYEAGKNIVTLENEA